MAACGENDQCFNIVGERVTQSSAPTTIKNLTIPEVLADLQKTIDRISSKPLPDLDPHKRDGTIFNNEEACLPRKGDAYYTEWVHPTPGASNAGDQRIVTGQGGEIYYSPDHYVTFLRIR
jgi:guanyl-specific ribonuclease Sa